MSLFVVDPGLASRVVDLGRPRSRALGVPVGGAADVGSFMLGNALVGNAPDAPALEIALKGPILRADAAIGCVLYGAPFDLSSARQTLRSGRTFTLAPGEELHIAGTPRGVRAYLCVRGGFEAPAILESRSGLANVSRGATLACAASQVHTRFIGWNDSPPCPDFTPLLRTVPGLQQDWFDSDEFYGQEFTVTPSLNRMGIRLQGTPLTLPARELVSEPVCPGSVQVTRDGQCILLGVDGQTIGGYPKIAQVIEADWDPMAQLRPGMKVRFAPISLDAARGLLVDKRQLLNEWVRRLRLSLEAW